MSAENPLNSPLQEILTSEEKEQKKRKISETDNGETRRENEKNKGK